MEVKVFDNVTEIVRDDMASTISKGSKVSIAAACFSMYAYKELKKQLESVDECRFIFTSPTFVTEKAEKQKRDFYIPRLNRESSLYGTEFELKLRNEMTQKAIAKECAEWIKRKATFKSNTTGENMGGFVTVANKQQQVAYMPMNGFTKGSMNSMQLRLIEESKIHCAREHFKAISNGEVVYDVVDSYKTLLDMVTK